MTYVARLWVLINNTNTHYYLSFQQREPQVIRWALEHTWLKDTCQGDKRNWTKARAQTGTLSESAKHLGVTSSGSESENNTFIGQQHSWGAHGNCKSQNKS